MAKTVLQKYIADAGYTSRRQAEELIRQGKVIVNGKIARLGDRVEEGDKISVGGKLIKKNKRKIYIILNKPEGYVCSNRRFRGEKNVFDLLLDNNGKEIELKHRLFVVGRLDKNSRGLVLLTNDGELAYQVTHPKFEHEKTYQVVIANNKLTIEEAKKISHKFVKGIKLEDKLARAKEVKYLGRGRFRIVLTQGMKRQIREMFKSLGYEVVDIKRIGINMGKVQLDLGDLKKGKWRCLKEEEILKINTRERC